MASIKEHNELAAPAYAAVPGRYWIESLKDGRHVLIRPMTERDREREYAFVKLVAAESRHMHLLTPDYEPDTVVPSQYNKKRMAYVALIYQNGKLIEIGISRYTVTVEHICEFAVTVADDWRRMHLGSILMRHLISTARRNGFQQMNTTDAASNSAMQHLAVALHLTTCPDPVEPTQVIYQLHL